jgi:hypothetical protein
LVGADQDLDAILQESTSVNANSMGWFEADVDENLSFGLSY